MFWTPSSAGMVGPNKSVPALSRRLKGRRFAPGIFDGCNLASAFTRLRGSGELLWEDEADDCEPLLEWPRGTDGKVIAMLDRLRFFDHDGFVR